MRKLITCLLAVFFTLYTNAQQPKQENTTTQFLPKAFGISAYANTKLTYEIIDAPNKTFGYDVYADGKSMIHQTSIPAMPGNEGFETKADAEKVAKLVINKIKKGEMPPTVSVEELQQLKVIL